MKNNEIKREGKKISCKNRKEIACLYAHVRLHRVTNQESLDTMYMSMRVAFNA